jgi:hypothetical protein
MDAQEAKGFDASEFTDEQCRNILAAIETARTLGFRDGQMAAAAHSAQVEAERDAALLELKFAKMQSRTHSDEAWRKKLVAAEAELVKLREALRQRDEFILKISEVFPPLTPMSLEDISRALDPLLEQGWVMTGAQKCVEAIRQIDLKFRIEQQRHNEQCKSRGEAPGETGPTND